jgi:hypothetical protein
LERAEPEVRRKNRHLVAAPGKAASQGANLDDGSAFFLKGIISLHYF